MEEGGGKKKREKQEKKKKKKKKDGKKEPMNWSKETTPFLCAATALSLTTNCCSSRLSASLSLPKSMGSWAWKEMPVEEEEEESMIASRRVSNRYCCCCSPQALDGCEMMGFERVGRGAA